MMSTVAVLNLNDSGAGSLRDVMNAAPPGDTVDLSALRGTIQLNSAIALNKDIDIIGPVRKTSR